MIAYLKGKLKFSHQNSLVIEVSGLGFQVQVPDEKYFDIGKEVELNISMVWNQETGPALFGFKTGTEKSIFDLVLSCSGCGPKIGLAVLNTMNPTMFLSAIACADVKSLSKVNGIGAKKAESMILQLKDKITKFELYETSGSSGDNLAGKTEDTAGLKHFEKLKDVNQALESLGYSRFEINNAMGQVKNSLDISVAKFDEILRRALMCLARKN